MAARKTFTVNWAGGVCKREKASKESKILAVLPFGEKVTVDSKADAAPGWTAIAGGGFVMSEYLK
jgi:hypothetical protein